MLLAGNAEQLKADDMEGNKIMAGKACHPGSQGHSSNLEPLQFCEQHVSTQTSPEPDCHPGRSGGSSVPALHHTPALQLGHRESSSAS